MLLRYVELSFLDYVYCSKVWHEISKRPGKLRSRRSKNEKATQLHNHIKISPDHLS